MLKKTKKIVIAGHVDHGKSTLIGRLLLDTNSLPAARLSEIEKIARESGKDLELAFLVDQLKEERRRKMTIDTTQTNFKWKEKNYTLIDAPGHKELIKNMLTGASMAESAILIIDAQQGLKEQTRRHAYLIKMLGIKQLIVVLNKMDLLDYRFKDFKKLNARLLSFLKALGIRPYCVIPLSAKEGENIVSLSKRMPWYRGEFLLQALDNMQPAQKEGKKPLRFCVQDTYQSGKEKIILGKVLSGSIKKNQRAVVMPSFKKIKIKAIRVYKEKRARAAAGESIGLIIRPALHIRRGGIISHPASPLMPRHKFNSRIFWLSAKPLRTQRHAFLRILAQEACCSVEKITQRINSTTLAMLAKESKELRLNEVAQVSWETKQPLLMENFSFIEELGRFVVESKNSLLGIGIITE